MTTLEEEIRNHLEVNPDEEVCDFILELVRAHEKQDSERRKEWAKQLREAITKAPDDIKAGKMYYSAVGSSELDSVIAELDPIEKEGEKAK